MLSILNFQRVLCRLCALAFLPLLLVSLSSAEELPALPEAEGKTIRSIKVSVEAIFDDPGKNYFYRKANEFKAATRPNVVRRELYLQEGRPYSRFLAQESLRNLRSQKFLRRVRLVPKVAGDVVDIEVIVQDTWTLIPQGSFSSGTGRNKRSVGVSESDLLGYGKRLEAAVEEDESRDILQGVWEDNRVAGSNLRLLGAAFQRSDGQEYDFYFGRPFRSLVEKEAWHVDGTYLDSIGRLFSGGDERYIYQQKKSEWNFRQTVAIGEPDKNLRRYSYGYQYINDRFRQATADDYESLDLDPAEVSNDPALLAPDRRFGGPVFSFEHIHPDFVSRNYIDRFDRVEDYDLGTSIRGGLTLAPELLGSIRDTLLASGSYTFGQRLSPDSFAREEFGFASRLDHTGPNNSLIRFQSRYYNVLGPAYLSQRFLGRHTVAAGLDLDYGSRLDKDRELLLGADSGLRGYEARTFTGDKRLVFNLEDRVHLAEDVFKLLSFGSALFLDAGGTTTGPLEKIITESFYADAGVGLRFAFPRSSGGRVLRVDLALPLRRGPGNSDLFEPRIIISGGQIFNSHLQSETLGAERSTLAVGFDD